MVLDSIGAFHYRDKMTEAGCGEGSTLAHFAVRTMAKLLAERTVVVLAAKPVLFRARDGHAFEHREYLPPAWQSLVGFRLNLVRENGGDGGPIFSMWLTKGAPAEGPAAALHKFRVSHHGLCAP